MEIQFGVGIDNHEPSGLATCEAILPDAWCALHRPRSEGQAPHAFLQEFGGRILAELGVTVPIGIGTPCRFTTGLVQITSRNMTGTVDRILIDASMKAATRWV
jgi:hypothetical protein